MSEETSNKLYSTKNWDDWTYFFPDFGEDSTSVDFIIDVGSTIVLRNNPHVRWLVRTYSNGYFQYVSVVPNVDLVVSTTTTKDTKILKEGLTYMCLHCDYKHLKFESL